MSMVASLLVQCDTYQQLYMAPDPKLRPPEAALMKLKNSIIQTYTKTQLFLGFAIQQGQSKKRNIVALSKLDDVANYVDELLQCEKLLVRVADDCEKSCNLSSRSRVEQFLQLKANFHDIIQDQMYAINSSFRRATLTNFVTSKSFLDEIHYDKETEMLEWISPILYGSHHDRVNNARTSDTCEWLLRHQKFREWKEASSSTILWLQGSRKCHLLNVFSFRRLTSSSWRW
jgi:ankyrin repeat domain-containing protein 50